uniref:Triosephosphate isomerase n=1 Tax=Heterosigma akashiwo TaxID=2829 RepID=A0A6V1N6L8_HETAK
MVCVFFLLRMLIFLLCQLSSWFCPLALPPQVHAFIRGWIAGKYGKAVADEVRIQYGGSVTPETVDELMAQPDIDGALVGGASLDAEKFGRIMNFKTAAASA